MKIIPIAFNTFRESVRNRVLYSLLLFVWLLIIASIVMGRIAVGQEAKIIIDVGLSAMTLFGVLIATFLGIRLISNEIENRTIAVILSKPVRRSTFVLGRYLGLCLTLLVNTGIMAVGVTLALIFIESGFDRIQLNLWPAAYLIFLELAVTTAVALLFSCFSSPALSGIFTLMIFLIGRWSPDLKLLAETSGAGVTRIVCRALYHLLPNMANFDYIDHTAYGQVVPVKLVIGNTVYALCYIAALLAASSLIFERRDLN